MASAPHRLCGFGFRLADLAVAILEPWWILRHVLPAIAGSIRRAHAFEETDHAAEALASLGLRRDDRRQRAGAGRTEQRTRRDHVGEVKSRNAQRLRLLHQRSRAQR